jgi:iron complex transport system ATP-binding protein
VSALLETRELCVQIADQPVCDNLHLRILPGEIWGVLGPNGSGKTTLLHTLAGLRKAVSGEILLREKAIKDFGAKEIAQQMGILFQQTPDSFAQSVFEFCLAGRHPHLSRFAFEGAPDKECVKAALTVMDLDKKAAQNVSSLSGGEKRRLSVATLLTQAPAVYLLDEPTNHLDIHHQIKVMDHFRQLATQQNIGMMMSLHDLNLAEQYCHRVLLLFANGETIQGTPSDILTTHNLTRLFHHPIQYTTIDQQRLWFQRSQR